MHKYKSVGLRHVHIIVENSFSAPPPCLCMRFVATAVPKLQARRTLTGTLQSQSGLVSRSDKNAVCLVICEHAAAAARFVKKKKRNPFWVATASSISIAAKMEQILHRPLVLAVMWTCLYPLKEQAKQDTLFTCCFGLQDISGGPQTHEDRFVTEQTLDQSANMFNVLNFHINLDLWLIHTVMMGLMKVRVTACWWASHMFLLS